MKTAKPAPPPMTVMAYAKSVLNFGMQDWKSLTEDDQDTLRTWARHEMQVLGIEIKP